MNIFKKRSVAVDDQRPAEQVQKEPQDITDARRELRMAEENLNMAVGDFVDAAIHRYNAALSMYQALIKEEKRGGIGDGAESDITKAAV